MIIPSVIRLIGAAFFLSILSILAKPVDALTPAQSKLKGQGSGVLISSGKVATNCHVVEGGASYQVGRGKQLFPATLFAEDGDKDICVLESKSFKGKPAQLGKAANLKVGVPVYAVGAPKGLELSLSDGIVSQLRGGPPPFIQTTAAISPGSSGGGLFDSEGRLVGLTTLYIEGGQNLNFAMPVEWIGEIKLGRKPTAEGHSQTEWLKRAIALEKMKDWKGLLDWSRMWIKSEPENSWAWYGLGVAYYHLKRYSDAIVAYNQALRIDKKHAQAWCGLGIAYGQLNHNNDAVEAYRQALRIDPKDAAAWTNLGNSYTDLQRYDEAIEAYREALRIDPEDAITWYNIGHMYGDLQRYDDAIDAYRQALRINPKHVIARYCLGQVYMYTGNQSAALEVVRELQRLDPERAEILFDQIVPR